MSVDTNKTYYYELSGKKVVLWKFVNTSSTDTLGSYKIRLPDTYFKEQLIYPNEAITNGLRFEYTALNKVFVDEDPTVTTDSSLTENTTPNEGSHVNLNRMMSLAIVDYIKALVSEGKGDLQLKLHHMREFWKKLGVNEGNYKEISISFTTNPFSLR